MRAMVLSECKKIEDKPLKLTNIERHAISNPDEVLIKIEACGVCHSQLHGIEGDWQGNRNSHHHFLRCQDMK